MKHFEEILQTIGFSEVKLLAENSLWDFWKAEFRSPISTQTNCYLYLKTRAGMKDGNSENIHTWTRLSGTGKYALIVPPKSSFAGNLEQTEKLFRATGAKTSRTFLLENILSSLELKASDQEPYYVDPTLRLYNGEEVVGATTGLAQWLLGKPGIKNFNRRMAVVVAHGGIGKTTLARALCNRIRAIDSEAIPILVESSHWSMYLKSDLQLKNVWDLAISRTFERPSRLLSNEAALRVLIREGLFIPIFDGFDELCLLPSSRIRPEDLILEMTELLEPEEGVTDARIMLTSRETYWSSIESKIHPDSIEVFRLNGFSNDQRKEYFKLRIRDHAKRDLASRIASQVGGKLYESIDTTGKNVLRPSGVPFILDLIANYVESAEKPTDIDPYEPDPLWRLLEAICVRENIRQTLDIPVAKQLELFEEMFRDYPDEIPISALGVYLGALCDVHDPAVVGRFSNHVFLIAKEPGKFVAKYEILRVYFLARFLAGRLGELNEGKSKLSVIETIARELENSTEVIDWLVGHLSKMPALRVAEAFKHARVLIEKSASPDMRVRAMAALVALCLRLGDGENKLQRLEAFSTLLGFASNETATKFVGLVFREDIRSIDFSTTTFQECSFTSVEFVNCKFSKQTVFNACSFEGTIAFRNCDDAAAVQIRETVFQSAEAELSLDQATGKTSNEELRTRFAQEALVCALKKFKGQFGFGAVQYRRRLSGFPRNNPYIAEVWGILLKSGLVEQHHISGVADGGLNLVSDAVARKEVSSFLENGVIGNRLRGCILGLSGRSLTGT